MVATFEKLDGACHILDFVDIPMLGKLVKF